MINQDIDCLIRTKQQELAAIKYFESNLPDESAIIEFGRVVKRNGKTVLVVTDQEFPTRSDYVEQTPVVCKPEPYYLAKLVIKYRKEGKLVSGIWHMHPMHGLSLTDQLDCHMHMLKAGFRNFLTGYYYDGKSAFYKYDDGFKEVKNVVVDSGRLDRQIRAYGYAMQMMISATTILVVGCGGGGFLTAHNLALKGYNLILVDSDSFTKDSLNRVWLPEELLGINKAVATKKILDQFTNVTAYDCTVEDLPQEAFSSSDLVVAFTDSVTSRLWVNKKVIDLSKPAIFLGSEIKTDSSNIQAMTGTCLVHTKGTACYNCNLRVDPNDLQRETLSPHMWKHFARKYGQAESLPPAPSIVELNSIVAAIGADQVTRVVTGYAELIYRQYIDLLHGKIIVVKEDVRKDCEYCAEVESVDINKKDIASFNEILKTKSSFEKECS